MWGLRVASQQQQMLMLERTRLCRLLKDEEVEVVVRYCFKHVTSEGSHILGALVQHCPACLRIYAKIAVFALQQCRESPFQFRKSNLLHGGK